MATVNSQFFFSENPSQCVEGGLDAAKMCLIINLDGFAPNPSLFMREFLDTPKLATQKPDAEASQRHLFENLPAKNITLPETNIAPEKLPSQKETSIPTIHFQVLC